MAPSETHGAAAIFKLEGALVRDKVSKESFKVQCVNLQ